MKQIPKTKKNCWEVMECGRQTGGNKVKEMGVCPAATSDIYDGINMGSNSGRFCWAVSGTYCFDEPQGTFVQKLLDCINCDFFKRVQNEQSNQFVFLPIS